MRAQSDLPVIVGLLCSVVSRQREPLRQPKPAKHTGRSGQCMMRQSGSVSRQKACRPGADATCCVKFYVLYPCWERSVHTLLVTGARLCFCTRDGATTGAVRAPPSRSWAHLDTRQEDSHEVFGLPRKRNKSEAWRRQRRSWVLSLLHLHRWPLQSPPLLLYTLRSGAGPHHILDGPGLVRACGREAARRSGHGVPIAACTRQATHSWSASWPGCVSGERMSRSGCGRNAVTQRRVAGEKRTPHLCTQQSRRRSRA